MKTTNGFMVKAVTQFLKKLNILKVKLGLSSCEFKQRRLLLARPKSTNCLILSQIKTTLDLNKGKPIRSLSKY